MRTAIIATVLLSVATISGIAQERGLSQSIAVKFAIDGKTVACDKLGVQLHLDGHTILPKHTDSDFTVPAAFSKTGQEWSSQQKVDVSVSCGKYTLSFPKLHPTWVSPGQWEVGIAYPPYWIERFGWTRAVEKGTWLTYLDSECNGCDPGIFTTISHASPPLSLLTRLRHEQPGASGERARDIAYALSVFGMDYHRNRDYLVELLNACLSRPKDSPEDDVCDSRLLDYLTNLYWRGDSGLLENLLQLADSRKDVILEIGTFYANLLDRHTAVAVRGMQKVSADKQRSICSLAGEDDFSIDGPKLKRVAERLHATGDAVAELCLQEAERAAGRVAQ